VLIKQNRFGKLKLNNLYRPSFIPGSPN